MTSTLTFDESKVAAVLDSNVLLDVLSCHNAYDALKGGDLVARDFRWKRAGDGLRLLIHLHEQGAATLSFPQEVERIAVAAAPPDARGFKTEYIRVFLYFVGDELLPNWINAGLPTHVPTHVTGNAADRMLVELAKAQNVPLISQETDPRKTIMRHAATVGVQVLTPADFCGTQPSKEAIERFMTDFSHLGGAFHQNEKDYKNAQEVLKIMYAYYRSVFEETIPAAHRAILPTSTDLIDATLDSETIDGAASKPTRGGEGPT